MSEKQTKSLSLDFPKIDEMVGNLWQINSCAALDGREPNKARPRSVVPVATLGIAKLPCCQLIHSCHHRKIPPHTHKLPGKEIEKNIVLRSSAKDPLPLPMVCHS